MFRENSSPSFSKIVRKRFSIVDLQRNRRRTVRGYRGARILQRSGRVSLYPTNPGKRTPLPPQWSCAQGPEST